MREFQPSRRPLLRTTRMPLASGISRSIRRGPRSIWLLGVAIVAFSPAVRAAEEGEIEAFRTRMAKWVETRQILSEERADWLVEKESLESTRDLLRRERDDLKKEIAAFEEADGTAERERQDLLLAREELQGSEKALAEHIRDLEAKVLAIVPQLPAPLRKRLDLLLVQIPEDPSTTDVSVGQRLMNVLGVLAQVEKWNSTANFVGETRAVGGGDQKVQVRTLYWGLGQAIYVDAQGKAAGVGRPTPSGWTFLDDPSLVDEAQRFLDIYEGNVDEIAFVTLPVEIR